MKRAAPTLAAGALALVYVIVSPASLDLAAHLTRAKLFSAEGFGLWDNWWYAGHHTLGYSVLFPPLASALTPQIVGAIATTAAAALFEPLAREHFGEEAWVGSLWFGVGTATNLFTGRLTFAFGLLPLVATALALQRRRTGLALAAAVLTALASPVAALFAALVGAAYALGGHRGGTTRGPAIGDDKPERDRRPAVDGLAVAAGALVPVALLAVAFPEGGSEPFTFKTLWPIPALAAIAVLALPRQERTLRAGAALYALACIATYLTVNPVGQNAARLGQLVAGPIAALVVWPRLAGKRRRHRTALLSLAAIPLVYYQWQASVRDVRDSANEPSTSAGYYRPVLAFLRQQSGPPFRVEIPFTKLHWEAYEIAPYFPLARGWERQLDIKSNHIFYGHSLSATTYHAWLHSLAIRFVAVADAPLDYSAHKEVALIDGGLPYLRLVDQTAHWRIYAVTDLTPIADPPATLQALGPGSLTLTSTRPATILIRVHFTPYWALTQGSGCVAPDGDFTKVTVRRAESVRLGIRFALSRIGSRSPRCS